MAITPDSDLLLLKCPLELDERNQITFSNVSAQSTYFLSLPHLEINNITYQRKDSIIRYPANIDSILTYNYVMYRNTNYTNKWFYAFITNMRYVNDNMTEITIKTDVFQTWQFNLDYKASFIEREHVTDDTLGKHTIPESLELGEYKINAHLRDEHLRDSGSTKRLRIVIASSRAPDTPDLTTLGNTYNGIYSGFAYYTYNYVKDDYNTIKNNTTKLLQDLINENESDPVLSVFIAPNFLCQGPGGGTISGSTTTATYDLGVSPITSLDTYTPVNKKLLTFPYCYILGSNANGANAIYHQEKFTNKNSDGEYIFRVFGTLTPGCSIKMVPIYYNGTDVNTDEGLNLGKYPQCSWGGDMYTNWITQNGVNVATSLIQSGTQFLGSLYTGNVSDTLNSSLSIANTLNEVHKAEMIPPQVGGNINAGDVTCSMNENTFHIYRMTIRKEYAKIIDDYFSMYGYKVNTLKQIAIHTRSNWNYVKTIGANIEGNIPQNDMQEIKQMFDNGVTFWHNTSNFLNYSVSNTIL